MSACFLPGNTPVGGQSGFPGRSTRGRRRSQVSRAASAGAPARPGEVGGPCGVCGCLGLLLSSRRKRREGLPRSGARPRTIPAAAWWDRPLTSPGWVAAVCPPPSLGNHRSHRPLCPASSPATQPWTRRAQPTSSVTAARRQVREKGSVFAVGSFLPWREGWGWMGRAPGLHSWSWWQLVLLTGAGLCSKSRGHQTSCRPWQQLPAWVLEPFPSARRHWSSIRVKRVF